MPKVGVILSGCGVFDGSEVHEAVITLLCLAQAGAEYRCMAPAMDADEVDHITKKTTGRKRSVLVESARIARGEIDDLAKVNVSDFDAFVLPGGFGAAKNLCTFASDGAAAKTHPQVERVLREANQAGKPIGLACIAPAVGAAVFGKSLHPRLTIGHDKGTAQGLEGLGARHVECAVEHAIVDEQHALISTPAYMEAKCITQVYAGIREMVASVLDRVGSATA